jgi:hypothetical protein
VVNISNSYQCIFSDCPTSPRAESANGRNNQSEKIATADCNNENPTTGNCEDYCKECQEDVACIAYDLAGNVVQLLVHIMK